MASSMRLLMLLLPLLLILGLARADKSVADSLVPVMLWCGNGCSGSENVNPLHRTSSEEFRQLLDRHLGKSQPAAAVFLKDNLCAEDIKKHHEALQKFNNSRSPIYLTYLTSVESAVQTLNSLSYNITEEQDFDNNDGQLAMIPINDLDSIPEKYSLLRDGNSNLIAILTGKTCSFTVPTDRYKREAADEGNSTKILLYIGENPSLKVKDKDFKLGNETKPRDIKCDEESYNVTLYYPDVNDITKISLKLPFKKIRGYFELKSIEYSSGEDSPLTLKSKVNIEFPYKFGYHCGQNITFSYKNDKKEETVITLGNIQVQMDTSNFTSDVYDCVGFMSVPIWTGIFVTFILAIITAWGLIMIMDIRTMDRFDDPKGKTITVSAQE